MSLHDGRDEYDDDDDNDDENDDGDDDVHYKLCIILYNHMIIFIDLSGVFDAPHEYFYAQQLFDKVEGIILPAIIYHYHRHHHTHTYHHISSSSSST